MAKQVTEFQMTLQGSLFQVKQGGFITFYDRYDDVCESVIQIDTLEDAANLEIISNLMDRRYWWKLTQGEIRDHEPMSLSQFADQYCKHPGVYIHHEYIPFGKGYPGLRDRGVPVDSPLYLDLQVEEPAYKYR